MVIVLASSAVDRGFEPLSGQNKNYTIGICYFSAKHVALRRKRKDWLARNQDNVSEWGRHAYTSTCFSELALNPSERVDLVQSRPHHRLIEN